MGIEGDVGVHGSVWGVLVEVEVRWFDISDKDRGVVYSSEPSFSVKSPRSYTCRGILFPSQTAPFHPTEDLVFILSTVARLAEKDSIEILA